MNVIVVPLNQFQMRTRGRGSKDPKILQMSLMDGPYSDELVFCTKVNAISAPERKFYFFVGQVYQPSKAKDKWYDPYTDTLLDKFDGDGSNTVMSSETEKCAYIWGNSSLKVKHSHRDHRCGSNLHVCPPRQKAAGRASPAVFATRSTAARTRFG